MAGNSISANVLAFSQENRRFLSCHGQMNCKAGSPSKPTPPRSHCKAYCKDAPQSRCPRVQRVARIEPTGPAFGRPDDKLREIRTASAAGSHEPDFAALNPGYEATKLRSYEAAKRRSLQFVRSIENSTASSRACFIGAAGNSASASFAMAP